MYIQGGTEVVGGRRRGTRGPNISSGWVRIVLGAGLVGLALGIAGMVGLPVLGRQVAETIHEERGLRVERYRWNASGYRLRFQGPWHSQTTEVPEVALVGVKSARRVGARDALALELEVVFLYDSARLRGRMIWLWDGQSGEVRACREHESGAAAGCAALDGVVGALERDVRR